MTLTKIFTFDAAHYLTKYYGKCEHLHGHTYRLEVTIEGPVHENGMILDFTILKNIVNKQVLKKVDHRLLNDIIENPSAENLVVWMWEQLSPLEKYIKEEIDNPNLPKSLAQYLKDEDRESLVKDKVQGVHLKKLVLAENATSYVTYKGEAI